MRMFCVFVHEKKGVGVFVLCVIEQVFIFLVVWVLLERLIVFVGKRVFVMDYIVANVGELESVVLGIVSSGALFPVGVSFLTVDGVYNFSVEDCRLFNVDNGRSALYMPGLVENVLAEIV